eukprot:TRINITY_DN5822_c2_g1_i1.p3 TRINITY_DN5822_c2_g1~~TRINITY_DN5822_c2_g1_i1.p3  ORF type:complete len:246 (-),score=14.97 TRINITY_DN5822_c2_g1_i1:677-1345(-)
MLHSLKSCSLRRIQTKTNTASTVVPKYLQFKAREYKQRVIQLKVLSQLDQNGVPDRYKCPITREIMKEPVLLLETGHTFEKEAIDLWLRDHATCPVTNQPLRKLDTAPVLALKQEILEYQQKHGLVFDAPLNGNPLAQQQMYIYVTSITGKTIHLPVTPQETIQSVKTQIENRMGIPANEISLIGNGRPLQQGTLQENNIAHEAKLHMAMRYDGGAIFQYLC